MGFRALVGADHIRPVALDSLRVNRIEELRLECASQLSDKNNIHPLEDFLQRIVNFETTNTLPLSTPPGAGNDAAGKHAGLHLKSARVKTTPLRAHLKHDH